jgi:hypothetical protein
MNDKHTGLGESLLLQRTASEPSTKLPQPPPQTFERSERHDVHPEPQQPPAPRKAQELRDRCTLYLDADVNTQLDLVARIERKQRSEVVTAILRENLPKYRVDRE